MKPIRTLLALSLGLALFTPYALLARSDSAAILAFNEASAKLQAELEHAYQRWNELDA